MTVSLRAWLRLYAFDGKKDYGADYLTLSESDKVSPDEVCSSPVECWGTRGFSTHVCSSLLALEVHSFNAFLWKAHLLPSFAMFDTPSAFLTWLLDLSTHPFGFGVHPWNEMLLSISEHIWAHSPDTDGALA